VVFYLSKSISVNPPLTLRLKSTAQCSCTPQEYSGERQVFPFVAGTLSAIELTLLHQRFVDTLRVCSCKTVFNCNRFEPASYGSRFNYDTGSCS